MILNVAKIICAEQWRYWMRTKVAATVLLLGAMLTIAALVVNAFHVDEAAHTDHLQTEAEQRFEAQPDKHLIAWCIMVLCISCPHSTERN